MDECQAVRARRRKRGHQPHETRRLQRQEYQDDRCNCQGRRLGDPAEADRQEEADEQNVLEPKERLGQLGSPTVRGKGEPDHQRAEVRLQAHLIKRLRSQADRQRQTQQQQQLSMAAPIEQPPIDGASGDDGDDHRHRPERWRSVDRHREEHHGKDVLDDQNANGDLTLKRRRLIAFFERLDREDGAREREGEPDQCGSGGRRTHRPAAVPMHRGPETPCR